MHALTQFILGLSALVTAGSLFVIRLELHKLRKTLGKRFCNSQRPERQHHRRRRRTNRHVTLFHTCHTHGVSNEEAQAGFAIYMFRNNRWVLEADLSAPGCESTPPSIPGSFEGQVVRKESSPRN